MSNLSDLLNDLDNSNAKTTAKVGDLLGTLADVSGAIGFVQLGIGFIESFTSQDDQTQELLNAITAVMGQIAQLSDQVSASDKLQRMRDIDSGINPAVGVFDQLPAILNQAKPPTQDFILTQIQTCETALSFFTDFDDKWQAVQADLPYFNDSWSGNLAPEADASGLVFNYTYTLPQFLRAITIFLTTVNALAPKSLSLYSALITRVLNRLTTIHETIVGSGIVGTKMPTANDLGRATQMASSSWVYAPPDWSNGSIEPDYPFGAVEIYSGANNVNTYPLGAPFPAGNFWGTAVTPFLALVTLRIQQRKKALYAQLGLSAVIKAINQLRNAIGLPRLTDPLYSGWSPAEVFSILGVPLPATSGGYQAALQTFLTRTPPYTSFQIWGGEEGEFSSKTSLVKSHPATPLPQGSLYSFLTGTSLTTLGLICYSPQSNGAYKVTFGSADMGQSSAALAFLPVTMKGDGKTQIAQLWDNNSELGMNIYSPQPDASYKATFSSAAVGQNSNALAFLPVTMNGDKKTQIVQLFDSNSRLGMNVFSPQSDGSYKIAFSSIDMGEGSGALAFLPVTMKGDGKTQILQIWNNSSRLGMIVYSPQADGSYKTSFGSADMGQGAAALAFLPVSTNGDSKTQILQLSDNNGRLGAIVYSPQPDGSYKVTFTSSDLGATSGAISFLPVTMNGDRKTQIVQLVNSNNRLGMNLFAPQPNGSYKLTFSSTDMGEGSGALAFLPVTMNGDGKTQIAQLWANNAQLGLIVYSPQSNGSYKVTFGSTDMGEGSGAVAFLPVTMNGDGKTQIVQLWSTQV